ncbi:MAG TPA: biotin/lipoyl-binding protein, partial [Casimicrobiaceae bacterium]
MSASRRTFFAIAGLAVIVAAAAFVMRDMPGSRAAAPPKATPAVPVTIAKVVSETIPVRLRAIGNVEAHTTVAVKARIDGQIVAVHFKEGDEVHKGDVLFEIDKRPF